MSPFAIGVSIVAVTASIGVYLGASNSNPGLGFALLVLYTGLVLAIGWALTDGSHKRKAHEALYNAAESQRIREQRYPGFTPPEPPSGPSAVPSPKPAAPAHPAEPEDPGLTLR